MDVKIAKRGQVTIFIILALIIVVLIILFFMLRDTPESRIYDDSNPQAFIESCTKESIEESLDLILAQGGDINPQGYVLYESGEVTYLCYSSSDYENCVNQRPLLIEHIEEEIRNYTLPRIESCFQALKTEYESRYDVEMGILSVNVNLEPKRVSIDISRDFKMSREGVQEYDLFKVNVLSPVYDLSKLATEIVNQEAQYCHFPASSYMILYPEYDIRKVETGNSDTIYTITELVSGESFRFAVRGCVLPAGL